MLNRHERRRAKVIETKTVAISDIRGCMCSWDRCGKFFEGEQPFGWTWLIMYRSPQATQIIPLDDRLLRDSALCPEHTKLLDDQLKDIGRDISAPPAGNG